MGVGGGLGAITELNLRFFRSPRKCNLLHTSPKNATLGMPAWLPQLWLSKLGFLKIVYTD